MEAPVTAEHWDPWTVYRVDRARMLASDADRERVMDTLAAAFAQGRLAKEEFLMRAGQTLASRTHGELAAINLSIPPRLSEPPPRRPAKVRGQSLVDAKSIAWGLFLFLMPATAGIGFVTRHVVFYFIFVIAFIGAAVAAQPDH
jgi:hypothetical protein